MNVVVRKIFVALMLVLLVMSSSIASAEDYYDWSKVPRIDNPQEFARYIERQRQAGETSIPVILTNGFTLNNGDFLALCPSSVISQRTVAVDEPNRIRHVIYTLMDYPSTKVINAYRSGNTIWLNAEEKLLYDKAVEIVNEAKKRNGTFNQEFCIYEEIANRVISYHHEDNAGSQPHFATAYGALVEGSANCQGYTDAFYLLGQMMGWNVGKMGGGGHQWNTIEFGDGKVYCVDVTWGDGAFKRKDGSVKLHSYIYFNAPAEIMAVRHQWDRALEPANLQPSVDGRYAYCMSIQCLRVSNAEAGLNLIAQKIGKENFAWCSVMAPYDERYSVEHAQQNYDYVINKAGKNFNTLHTWRFGKYLFFTADTFGS